MHLAVAVYIVILGLTHPDGYESKRYDNCALARELHYYHGIPKWELGDWLCMVEHESNYQTHVTSRIRNHQGFLDHGIFQINGAYWCDHGNRGCGIPCYRLRDDNISDDVRCAKHIKNVHRGFGAWVAWNINCQGWNKQSAYVDWCNL